MSSKTSEGLRDRLFDTLDALIDKKIGTKEAESICYVSEQILKTANFELEMLKERNNAIEKERKFQLELKREEKNTSEKIVTMIENLKEIEVEEDDE